MATVSRYQNKIQTRRLWYSVVYCLKSIQCGPVALYLISAGNVP